MKAIASALGAGDDGVAAEPRLDIVIVNWNAGALLRQCIDSVFQSDEAGFRLDRVVVVDNASSDGSADGFSFPRLTVMRLPENRGFAKGCNIGAAGSRADYLLFLNPDILLDRDTMSGAVRFMERARSVTASTVKLRDLDGNTQRCCARFPTPIRMLAQGLGLDRLFPKLFPPHFLTDWDHEDTRTVPQVMGAFLLIRRPAFERLGGFDERFFVYYEDVDLCRRIALDGGRCVHNAAATARHVGGGTTNRIKARRQFLGAQSRIRYARKYFGWPAATMLTFAGMLLDPLARVARGVAQGSASQIVDAIRGAAMLWADLPRQMTAPVPSPDACARRAEPRRLRVLALTRYPRQGASSRTRFLSYFPALRADNVALTVSPFFDDDYLRILYSGARPPLGSVLFYYLRRLAALLRVGSYDLIWVEKEALPWVPYALEGFLLRRTPYIVDFDDAWFLRYGKHRLGLVRQVLGRKLETLVRHSGLTVVGNDYLADWAREAGAADIAQFPTPVNLDVYRPIRDIPQDGPLRIGWMGTPTSASAYLRPLFPVLEEAIREGWATLTVVGASGDEFKAIGADVVAWSEDREVDQLHSFDVGIMPLAHDLWSAGKCAYKLIQYMAVGLPVIASPVGMNRKVVHHGINGFLADDLDAWRTALKTLAADRALCRRMGEAGRQIVSQHYCLAVVEPRLVAAIRGAAEKKMGEAPG